MDVLDPYQPIVGYTDFANYTGFVHFNPQTANFVEKVGERAFLNLPSSLIGAIPQVTTHVISRKIGSLITIQLPPVSAVGNNSLQLLQFSTPGSIPPNYMPALVPFSAPVVINGGAGAALPTEIGAMTIFADGTFQIAKLSAGNFNGAGAGYPAQNISYYAVL
jgi:hypothetical protein